jgi:nucleotide-binding universal stress UspA family protein
VAAAVEVVEGDIPASILDESRRDGTALIAMATHDWRNREIFRSVTERVLSGTRIPMLIVRSHPAD